MKICFFTKDEELDELIDQLQVDVFDNAKQLLKEIESNKAERSLVFLDFDMGERSVDKLAKRALKLAEDPVLVGLVGDMDAKKLRKRQESKSSLNAYLFKPIDLETVQEVLNDFELADHVLEREALDEGTEIGTATLTILNQLRADEEALSEIDEEKEDYDTTEGSFQLPEDFSTSEVNEETESELEDQDPPESIKNRDEPDLDLNKKSGSFEIEEDDLLGEEEMSDDEQNNEVTQFAFDPSILKILEQHELSGNFRPDLNDPINLKIQSKFDSVFGKNAHKTEGSLSESITEENKKTESRHSEEESEEPSSIVFDMAEEGTAEGGEVEMSDSSNEKPDEEEIEEISFDLGQEEEEGEDVDDTGLDFSFEDEGKNEEPKEDGGLEFNLGEGDDEDDLAQSAEDNSQPNEDGEIDFSLEDTNSKLIPGDIAESIDDLNLGESTGTDLDLAVGDDSMDLTSSGVTETDTIDLDLGTSDEITFDDSETAASHDQSDDLTFGDLDLSDEDDDEEVDKTIVAGEEDLLAGHIPSSEAAVSPDNGGDLPSGLPSELTEGITDGDVDFAAPDVDGLDISPEDSEFPEMDGLIEADSEDNDSSDDIGDSTNPTVVVNAQDALSSLEKSESKEVEDSLFEDTINAEMAIDENSLEEQVSAEEATEEDNWDADDGIFARSEEQSEPISAAEPVITEEIPVAMETPTEAKLESREAARPLSSIGEDEMLRMQATLQQLKEEREDLLKELQKVEEDNKQVKQENLGLKADLDEAKIEITILKKRHVAEVEEIRYQTRLAEEKKDIYELRCRNYQKEFERLNQKVRIEFNQVKQREKELESQLELTTMDSEAQIQARDKKILELKRKIDQLEFNIENATIKEQKSRDDKVVLEDKIEKMIRTLRGSLKVLEQDIDLEFEEMRKNNREENEDME